MDKTRLIAEMRDDFQIPPYFDDEVIGRAVDECATRLQSLNPTADFETDKEGRMLLKNATYYSIYHRYEEFEQNYASLIYSWQLGAEV